MSDGEVRTNGDDTFFDIVLGMQARRVSVSREAIEDFLHLAPERAAVMTADDRREFVETNFVLVMTAADRKLKASNSSPYVILIRTGDL